MSNELSPYRTHDLVEGPPPNSWVGLVWRWILLRRAERMAEAEAEAHRKRFSIHMRRDNDRSPYMPYRVEVSGCPGRSAPRPSDIYYHQVLDYWLCSKNRCCCEFSDGVQRVEK